MERLTVDTTLLIDLQRERRNERGGPATDLLNRHADAAVLVSCVAWGEFLEGFEDLEDDRIPRLMSGMTLLAQTEATAKVYSRIARHLRAGGNPIGANYLWIAATSIERALPLVTRNGSDFRRIPDLRLIAY